MTFSYVLLTLCSTKIFQYNMHCIVVVVIVEPFLVLRLSSGFQLATISAPGDIFFLTGVEKKCVLKIPVYVYM